MRGYLFILSLSVSCVYALPNPASVYCKKHGGQSIVIKNTGICIFKDESYCEEWAFFKGKCKKAQLTLPEKLSQYNAKEYCTETIDDESELMKCKITV